MISFYLGWVALAFSQGLTWEYPDSLAPVAKRFEAEADTILDEAYDWLGVEAKAGGMVQLVASHQGMERVIGHSLPSWFAAVTVPQRHLLIMSTEKAKQENVFRVILRHELAHLAMAAMPPSSWQALPAWFHEGVAQAFAGHTRLGRMNSSLTWRALFGEIPHLRRYEEGFGMEPLRAADGYSLAHRQVELLLRSHGPQAVKELLKKVQQGSNLEQASLDCFGLSLVTLEEQMRDELSSFRSVAAGLVGELVTWVLLLALLLIPWVIVRRRRQRRLIEAQWMEESEADEIS